MKLRTIKKAAAAVMAAICCLMCTGCDAYLISALLSSTFIPTMTGYAEDSRITSANSTATQIKHRTTEFLTKMDAARCSFISKPTVKVEIMVNGGKWEILNADSDHVAYYDSYSVYTPDGGNDWYDGNDHWGRYCDASDGSCADRDRYYLCYVADSFLDLKNGYIEVWVTQGKVTGVTFTEKLNVEKSRLPDVNDFMSGYTNKFPERSGKLSDGTTVGTSPMLGIADGYVYYAY